MRSFAASDQRSAISFKLLQQSRIARRSAGELEYHLLLARDLHLLQEVDHLRLGQDTGEIKRMLTALLQKPKAES